MVGVVIRINVSNFLKNTKYSESRNICESLNATMISIHSSQENDFVLNLVQKQSHIIVWLGGKRNSHNSFEWINENAFNYTNWFSGEPDSGDYVIMYRENGKWWESADQNIPFLCQYMRFEINI